MNTSKTMPRPRDTKRARLGRSIIVWGAFLVLAPLSPLSAAAAAGPVDPSAKVLTIHDQAIAAAEALDIDRLFSFVADTASGSLVSGGTVYLTRAEALANTRQGFRNIAAIKYAFDSRRVIPLSDTSAVLVATGSSSVTTMDGRSFSQTFVQSVVFVRENDEWRIVHTHQSFRPSD